MNEHVKIIKQLAYEFTQDIAYLGEKMWLLDALASHINHLNNPRVSIGEIKEVLEKWWPKI